MSKETSIPTDFMEYFRANYPGPHTIIANPDWHAPKIYRAAIAASPMRELLEVCRMISDIPQMNGLEEFAEYWKQVCIAANAAVAKAEGREDENRAGFRGRPGAVLPRVACGSCHNPPTHWERMVSGENPGQGIRTGLSETRSQYLMRFKFSPLTPLAEESRVSVPAQADGSTNETVIPGGLESYGVRAVRESRFRRTVRPSARK